MLIKLSIYTIVYIYIDTFALPIGKQPFESKLLSLLPLLFSFMIKL